MNNEYGHWAWIGIGANIGDAVSRVQRALVDIGSLPDTQSERHSRLYRTRPLPSPVKQDDYINAVALVRTRLRPQNLLAALLRIELVHGRVRPEGGLQNLPRTLDLDLLLYDTIVLTEDKLQLPHPRLAERGFVLIPLLDVSAGLRLPDGREVAVLAASMSDHGIDGYYDKQGVYTLYDAKIHQPLDIV
ncbi:MAG: 2-amino-4-hydroxy-6-hydroxymethyldihydropteridine diphosphokinase [Proteobacteria bacterium]|nr:2-amino-4-hydroxy-6-hydroxymethyldihydropteridine diphosphokinase [Pseudomonadota bacterium]